MPDQTSYLKLFLRPHRPDDSRKANGSAWNGPVVAVLCSLLATLSCAPVLAQHLPTPVQQAIIDKDNSRHFGDDPVDGGPLTKDLSPALKSKDIEAAMRKVGDWQLQRSQPYFDRIWTWSVLYMGFLAASDATGDPAYRNAVEAYSEKVDWKLRSFPAGADDQSMGQAYVELYFHHKDPARIAPTRAELDAVMAMPDNPKRLPWWWCDALFMAPGLWARMSTATGDQKYLAYMDKEWWETSNLLYDQQRHLYFRDATYLNKHEENGQPMFWSRGNGWVMAGIVRVLEYLPKNDPMRPKYIEQLKEMSASVAALQGKDGLWRAGLLDPNYYVLPETSGSALMTYAMAWGVNNGILDKHKYKPVVAKAWKGLLAHVYADGRLGCIQQTGAEPAFYRPTASYTYGVGAFLLAGSELDHMAKGKK
ncbi:MAG: glycoside hydrolase family 88/105 protein [Acidobacteriaceae bacterium]